MRANVSSMRGSIQRLASLGFYEVLERWRMGRIEHLVDIFFRCSSGCIFGNVIVMFSSALECRAGNYVPNKAATACIHSVEPRFANHSSLTIVDHTDMRS